MNITRHKHLVNQFVLIWRSGSTSFKIWFTLITLQHIQKVIFDFFATRSQFLKYKAGIAEESI